MVIDEIPQTPEKCRIAGLQVLVIISGILRIILGHVLKIIYFLYLLNIYIEFYTIPYILATEPPACKGSSHRI